MNKIEFIDNKGNSFPVIFTQDDLSAVQSARANGSVVFLQEYDNISVRVKKDRMVVTISGPEYTHFFN